MVISSCSGTKAYSPSHQLNLTDFANRFDSLEQFNCRQKELYDYRLPAAEMYQGLHHQNVLEGFKRLSRILGPDKVSFYIISAGYGLINASEQIVPYNCSFSDMKAKELDWWASRLDISDKISQMQTSYTLSFVLLGENYLRAARPDKWEGDNPVIFFCSRGKSLRFLKRRSNYYTFMAGNHEAKKYQYGTMSLKGYLFNRLAKELEKLPQELENLVKNPSLTVEKLLSNG